MFVGLMLVLGGCVQHVAVPRTYCSGAVSLRQDPLGIEVHR